ncbi:MAG TPA: GNAT family N-acetyltransferase [Anaerolineaceae bacterium]|nr:GNAT family N-acetyltransferase [Anaerolineaceae bacterium]
MKAEIVTLSDLDTDRFGIIVARTGQASQENLPEVMDFCEKNQVKLLIARCSTSHVKSVHSLERNGFLLMDTLVYLRKDIRDYSPQEYRSELTIRTFRPDDLPQVVEVARSSFSDYKGHYHVDDRLNSQAATEVYASWAERCCLDPSVAARVLVAESENRIVGFRAIRINTVQQAEFILAAVAPEARNKGIYRNFVVEGLRWCKEMDTQEVLISTLLVNTAVQKTCERLGFTAHSSFYTFHKWFD